VEYKEHQTEKKRERGGRKRLCQKKVSKPNRKATLASLLFEKEELTRVSLRSFRSILGFSSWQRDSNLLEQTLDVVTGLGRSLDGKNVELLRLLVELLGRDLPETRQKSKTKGRSVSRSFSGE